MGTLVEHTLEALGHEELAGAIRALKAALPYNYTAQTRLPINDQGFNVSITIKALPEGGAPLLEGQGESEEFDVIDAEVGDGWAEDAESSADASDEPEEVKPRGRGRPRRQEAPALESGTFATE